MNSSVLITGATGGLGKAFAAECASRGWNLFLTDLNGAALASVAAGLNRMYGIQVQTFAADLTGEDEREALWQHIEESGLRFHSLFNVAGIDYEGLFNERKVGEIRSILRLNVESTVETTRRALQFRDPVQPFRIVNVCSLAAFYPMPVKAVYASSKRFLLDWSLALNQELRSTGVTVTALCPAGMPSNPEVTRAIDAQGWMGRITTMNVGDVAARTIDRALSGRTIYIPGVINQVLRVLGGMFPPQLVAYVIDKRWRKSYQKSSGGGQALAHPAASK
ncbi:MAG: SDR family NAD(P)-dependent oxidoreductase [Anaerolineae bacterium]|nr:SDR family NAD(P)-dependent oxidoreductase [Anaerolineae bacterium]